MSVVMPFYNHGMFVHEAVGSVRAQSRAIDEIVIVDDGSTDLQSREALDQLEQEGVKIVRQGHRGPAAARNAGVDSSDGDAVLFLDSDDLLSDRQVEMALAILAEAPPDVGFVYPDMQFFGNERELVVMPPYNLYLLLHRNFCGMGSIIDQSVFDAGHRFRTELIKGHEDWDFFVSLGKNGIFGAPIHGQPLQWRRWGYSRSDSVHESKGTFLEEIRELHPDLYDNKRLIEVKREWSPALSIVAPAGEVPAVTSQSCDDFEIVEVSASGIAPEVRGRWVLLLGEDGTDRLREPTFVERLLRLLEARPLPAVIGLELAPRIVFAGWERGGADRGVPVGVAVDGNTYADFQRSEGRDGSELQRLLARLDPLDEPSEWWMIGLDRASSGNPQPGRGARPGCVVRAALPPPTTPGGEDDSEPGGLEVDSEGGLSEQAAQIEIRFRRAEASPLYIPHGGFGRLPEPPRGFRDGLAAITQKAWRGWTPSRTRKLNLVVDAHGRAFLETTDDDAGPSDIVGAVSRTIGRVWVRPFPGTASLYSSIDVRTHTYSYRVSEGPPRDKYELPIGYVAIEALTGADDLRLKVEEAARTMTGRRVLVVPAIEVESAKAYVERAPSLESESVELVGATDEPRSPGRRWPLFELMLRDGGLRYTRSPDACMASDTLRPSAVPIAELAEPRRGGGLLTLYEVKFRQTGGPGYVSGVEIAFGIDRLEPVQALGDITERRGVGVPMVRLHPEDPQVPPAGEPGHRLAIDWQPHVATGYVVEGVVGFAWEPDTTQAPMYRWRNRTGDSRRLTLGEPPEGGRRDWIFEGTLGAAWRAGTWQTGLVDLWEMERLGNVVYTTYPEEFELQGFSAERIIGRVLRERMPGSLPLHHFTTSDGGPSLTTTCTDEGLTRGLANECVIGFLGPAIPPPPAGDGPKGIVPPPWAVPIDRTDAEGNSLQGLLWRDKVPGSVAIWLRSGAENRLCVSNTNNDPSGRDLLGYATSSLTPFAQPVYVLRHASAGTVKFSSILPRDDAWHIEDICCFLPGERSARPQEPVHLAGAQGTGTAPQSARAIRRAVNRIVDASRRAGLIDMVRRSGLLGLVPPQARHRARRWLA